MLFDPNKMGGMSVGEFIEAKNYYEACCTAEFIIDTCKSLFSEEEALDLGYETRRRMNKAEVCDGISEAEFISEIICEMMEEEAAKLDD